MKKILIVVGTRPNFIKITQFRKLVVNFPNLEIRIAHTGQHFTENMSDVFFEQFDLVPDFYLNIDSSSALQQMGEILIKLEKLIKIEFYPDLIIVPGDVNSTLAVSIVANKLEIPLAHLESGLRSNDRTMPEEINRIITDEISDYYFVTESSGLKNLEEENKKGKVFFVGNTMIDSLVAFENEIDKNEILKHLGLKQQFVLMTIHRPSNVDDESGLRKLLDLILQITKSYQLVFPIHPRTKKNIDRFDLTSEFSKIENLILVDALGYFEFQKLIKSCSFVLTDSGGIQEETTYRKVPCLTLRDSTERPSTVDIGSNTLVPFDIEKINKLIEQIETGTYKKSAIPEYWDGKSTERILSIIDKMSL